MVGVSFSRTAHRVFVALLSTLVVLLAIWLAMIARILIRVLRGGSAEDVRSDDEEWVCFPWTIRFLLTEACLVFSDELDQPLPEASAIKERLKQQRQPRKRDS